MQNELKKGVIITYITLIAGNLISFLYTPYMLGCLGKSEYGLLSFVNSIVAYISLIDSGFGSAVIRYNSEYIASKQLKKQTQVNGMFLKLFGLIGLASVLIGAVIIAFMGDIFTKYTEAEVIIAQKLLALAVLNLGISFPLNVFSSIILSFEHFSFNKGITLVKTIASPVISIAILYAGGKSVPLMALNLFITIVVGTLNVGYCFGKLKIRISFGSLDKKLIKQIWSYSFYIFLSMIAYQIYWNTDQFIIGKIMGAAPIAIYAIGMSFNNYFRTFSDFASGLFLPRLTKAMSGTEDPNCVLDDLIKVSRMQLFMCLLIYSGFFLLGKQFIVCWVGSDYIDAYVIAIIIMTPQIISIIQSLFATLLQAMNKHRVKSYIYLAMAFVNIVLTVLFAQPFGIVGCAVATAIGMMLNAVANNVYYSMYLKIRMKKYWISMLKPLVIVVLVTSVAFICINRLEITNYFCILVVAIVYMLAYLGVFWMFVFNQHEKEVVGLLLKKLFIFNKLKLAFRGRSSE